MLIQAHLKGTVNDVWSEALLKRYKDLISWLQHVYRPHDLVQFQTKNVIEDPDLTASRTEIETKWTFDLSL